MKPVLIIEDEAVTARLLEKLLKAMYPVVRKENGLEALLWIREGNQPSLIIADLNMPVMNGYELIAKIKSDQRYSRIPLIVISSENDVIIRNKCYKAGANRFFTKPFDNQDLLRGVYEVSPLTASAGAAR